MPAAIASFALPATPANIDDVEFLSNALLIDPVSGIDAPENVLAGVSPPISVPPNASFTDAIFSDGAAGNAPAELGSTDTSAP